MMEDMFEKNIINILLKWEIIYNLDQIFLTKWLINGDQGSNR